MFERSITGQDFQTGMLILPSSQIRSVREMRLFYRPTQREDLWHEDAKRNTLPSKNEKPMTSRGAIKSAALAAKKLSAAHGQPSTNQISVAARRVGEVAGKSGANRARAKVGEKAAGNESLTVANDIASAAMNY